MNVVTVAGAGDQPSALITTAYAHSRVFFKASPDRWPKTGTFGSIALGCTDVCGTATLEGQKILRKILISIGFAMNGYRVAKREQPKRRIAARRMRE